MTIKQSSTVSHFTYLENITIGYILCKNQKHVPKYTQQRSDRRRRSDREVKYDIPVIEGDAFDGIHTIIHLVTCFKHHSKSPFTQTGQKVKVSEEPRTSGHQTEDYHLRNTAWIGLNLIHGATEQIVHTFVIGFSKILTRLPSKAKAQMASGQGSHWLLESNNFSPTLLRYVSTSWFLNIFIL